jgi:hypothetical protein
MENSKQDPGRVIRRASPRDLAEEGARETPTDREIDRARQQPGAGETFPDSGTIPADDEERRSLDLYVDDLARELGDRAPLRSSGSRLLNIYRRSGLDLGAFVEQVQRARRTTKERLPGIRGERRPGRPKAAMSYFFAVLEDNLGIRL